MWEKDKKAKEAQRKAREAQRLREKRALARGEAAGARTDGPAQLPFCDITNVAADMTSATLRAEICRNATPARVRVLNAAARAALRVQAMLL